MNLYNLYGLIKSMTSGESRAFSKLASKKGAEKNYIRLFDYLHGAKNIDFEGLEKTYGKHGLEAARKYLFKVLMMALRNADNEHGLENKLIDLLKDAQIFHRKGFIKECFEHLTTVKKIALKNEQYSYYLIAARLELRFLSRKQFAGIDEFELIKKQRSVEDILEHEILSQRHSKLQEILLIRYWHKGIVNTIEGKNKLNDLLLEEYNILNNNRNYRSFESQKTHLNFQSIYFLMIGDHAESLKIFYELNTLYQKNKTLWIDSPEYYLALLDGILTDMYAMGTYSEMSFFIDQLSKITTSSEDLAQKIELLTIYYQLSVLNQTDQYVAGKLVIEGNKSLINKHLKGAPSNRQAQLCLSVCLIYFNNQEYKDCARLLNLMLNAGANNSYHETYNQLKTLYLMTQYELKNYDYLPYQIRSFQRKLNLDKQEAEVEKLTISMINQLCARQKFYAKNYQQYMSKLNELKINPQLRNFIQKLQLEKWLKSHLT